MPPLRLTLGRVASSAQAGTSLLAGVGLVVLLQTCFRGTVGPVSEEMTWAIRGVELASGLYLALLCLIHARWSALVRRELPVSIGVAAAVALSHLLVAAAVGVDVWRQWDSRALFVQLDLLLTMLFTFASVGCVVSLLSLWSDVNRNHGSVSFDDPKNSLSGWKHQIPPLLAAILLISALVNLELHPLPRSSPLARLTQPYGFSSTGAPSAFPSSLNSGV